ncbi:MAG: helix-turn-helix domain-containing protein [Roseburia sp.]|nr:helix-turn-helix domain-containing protein [Roseburia sp.]
MINQIKIGQFIAESRKNLNLTQKQLAEEIGVTDKTISKWETGNRLPDAALLMDLCRILQVDVNELLKGERVNPENYDQNAKDTLVDLVGEINVIKQEKRGQYVGTVLGVASIVCAMVMVKSLGTAGLFHFFDIYTLLFLMGLICLILTVTGCFHDFISVWKVCILRKRISEREMKAAVQTVSFACQVTLIVGVIISTAGIVSVVGHIGTAEILGPPMAQTVLSVLYTALLELIHAVVLFRLKKETCHTAHW